MNTIFILLLFIAVELNAFQLNNFRHISTSSENLKDIVSTQPSGIKFYEYRFPTQLYINEKDTVGSQKEPSAFDKVASTGLAGVLAIACAEAIFWAAGMPLATLWVKFTTGEWIDLMSKEGQLQAAGFTFGYGGFATLILQYRVTLFAIPLVPIMEKLVVEPGKRYFGEQFGKPTIIDKK